MNSISERGVPMPISMDQVKERLERYSTIEDLEDKDKQRIYRILKVIGQNPMGTRISDIKRNNLLRMSNTHLTPSINWLRECGYLDYRKGHGLILNDEGMKALQMLERHFYSPHKEPELKIYMNLDEEKEITVTLSDDLRSIDKLVILSNPFIRASILKLSNLLTNSANKKFRLTITIPPTWRTDLLGFLDLLWHVYWQTLKKSGLKGPVSFGMILRDEETVKSAYISRWKDYLEKFLRLPKGKVPTLARLEVSRGKSRTWFIEQPLLNFLHEELDLSEDMNSLFMIYLEYAEVRAWVENRLKETPDWFMPHFFWARLGFKLPPITMRKAKDLLKDFNDQMCFEDVKGTVLVKTKTLMNEDTTSRMKEIIKNNNGICVPAGDSCFKVEFVEHVSPPLFTSFSSPEINEEYFSLETCFRFLKGEVDDRVIYQRVRDLLRLDLNSEEFYRNWMVLKGVEYWKEIEEAIRQTKLIDVIQIFDAAHTAYICTGQASVDTKSALSDYLVSKDADVVVRGVREGKYGLKENGRKL